ncbi:VWA domain-containing protein [Mycobacterium sp. 236(2023)]|uniref:VWA domain-containing protein n=1 Tax=Mycobacterium sp. 236(2023) TaxID=3038163 RepID=UPI00241553A0|nr:VWA domain-containing protein [Mycobacterium sp. 236(2023)]MDG4669368.1 VWA domain-containing protein [Mycobacterium sp. 236(2023)]
MTFLPVLPAYLLASLAVVVVILRLVTLYRLLTRAAPGRYRRVVLRWSGLTAAVLLLVLSAYRPGIPDGQERAESGAAYVPSINVFFVVDRSLTSRVADYGDGQARMVGMRDDIAVLIEVYRGARFNLIGFATEADVEWPLSQDEWSFRAYVKTLAAYSLVPYDALDFIDPTTADDVLTSQLREAERQYPDGTNVVYYLGDGAVGSQAQPSPFDVPSELIAGGAVLGYGTTAGGAVPASIADGRRLYYAEPGTSTLLTAKLNEPQLTDIAESLDMEYHHREAGQPIRSVLPAIDSGYIPDTPAGPEPAPMRTELYWIFALLAAALLLVEGILTVRELRRNRLSRSDISPGRVMNR